LEEGKRRIRMSLKRATRRLMTTTKWRTTRTTILRRDGWSDWFAWGLA
jgi:hypothetical protein